MNPRLYEIQAAEVHKNDSVEIHFEHEDKLFKPRRLHIPIQLRKHENKPDIPPAKQRSCAKCIVM